MMRQRLDEWHDQDQSFGPVGEDRAEPPQPQSGRRLPTGLLTLVVMLVFAGGLYFAYVQGTHHAPATGSAASSSGDSVPLIRADEHPTKVKPDQPGGMDVPDRDKLVFTEKPGGPPVEKLLPGPEQPAPRPVAPPPPPAPPPTAAPQAGIMVQPFPPNATPTVEPAPTTKPAAPAEQQAAIASPKVAPKPPTEAKPMPESKATAAPSTATAGGIRVQLGSLRTPDEARQEWARLKGANADVLGSVTAVAVRADLGERGIYYRIQAGPFTDAAAAERICGTLKKRNLGCSVVR